MAVPVTAGQPLQLGVATALFTLAPVSNAPLYDVAPDGRFLVVVGAENAQTEPAPPISVVGNWQQTLRAAEAP